MAGFMSRQFVRQGFPFGVFLFALNRGQPITPGLIDIASRLGMGWIVNSTYGLNTGVGTRVLW